MRTLNKKKREEHKNPSRELRNKHRSTQTKSGRRHGEKAAKQEEKQATKTNGESSTIVRQKHTLLQANLIQHMTIKPDQKPKFSSSEHINYNQYCAWFGLYEDDTDTGL